MFIDSHTHLNLQEKNIENIIKKCKEKNVKKIITNSTSFNSNIQSIELSQKYEEIFACIGLYPLDALELNNEEINRAFDFFEKNYKKAIAIGEVGLDYKFSKKENEKKRQQIIFEKFIDFSIEKDLPIVIHSRYATKKVIQTLENKEAKKVYLHSFTDSSKLMLRAAKNNYYCGVGMNILTDDLVKQRIKKFPIEKLLLETDSPLNYNNTLIFPDKIPLIAQEVANLKDTTINTIEKQLETNNKDLFKF